MSNPPVPHPSNRHVVSSQHGRPSSQRRVTQARQNNKCGHDLWSGSGNGVWQSPAATCPPPPPGQLRPDHGHQVIPGSDHHQSLATPTVLGPPLLSAQVVWYPLHPGTLRSPQMYFAHPLTVTPMSTVIDPKPVSNASIPLQHRQLEQRQLEYRQPVSGSYVADHKPVSNASIPLQHRQLEQRQLEYRQPVSGSYVTDHKRVAQMHGQHSERNQPCGLFPTNLPHFIQPHQMPAYAQCGTRLHYHVERPQRQPIPQNERLPRAVVDGARTTSSMPSMASSRAGENSTRPIFDRKADRPAWSHLQAKDYNSSNFSLSSSGPWVSLERGGQLQTLSNLRITDPGHKAAQQIGATDSFLPHLPRPSIQRQKELLFRNRHHEQSLTFYRSEAKRSVHDTRRQISLDTLPVLVLLKVLSYLPVSDLVLKVRLTCKYLNELSYDPSLWKSINIDLLNRYRWSTNFTAQLLKQDCFIAGRVNFAQLENEAVEESAMETREREVHLPDSSRACHKEISDPGGVDEQDKMNTTCQQVTQNRRQVKDHIRKLSIHHECQTVEVYVYSSESRSRWREVGHSGVASVDTPVCPRLHVLNISCSLFTPSILTLTSKHPWLTELSVTIVRNGFGRFVRVTEAELQTCYNTFQMLKHLKKFKLVFPNSDHFNNGLVGNLLFFYSGALYATMRKFFEAVSGLEEIVVTDVSDNVLKTITSCCRSLRRLAFSSHVISHYGFRCGTPLSTLKSLTISSTLSCLDSNLGSEIAHAFPNLTMVNLAHLRGTDQGLMVLLEKCRHLDIIHLNGNTGEDLPQTSRPAVYLQSSLSQLCAPQRSVLRELSLPADVDDQFIRSLCACNTALTSLSLTDCPKVTDASLVTVAALCPRLTCLRLCQDQSHVTAKGVLTFIHSCPSLTSLHVSSTTNKGRFVPGTDTCFGDFWSRHEQRPLNSCSNASLGSSDAARVPSARREGRQKRNPGGHRHQLRELSLGRVPQMTCEDLTVLVDLCPDLAELHLSGCLRLGDKAVDVILRGCPRLRSLTLDRQARGVNSRPCPLTDTTLLLLAQLGTSLRHFRATQCYRFTSPALARLLVLSRSLETVSLTVGASHSLKGFAGEVDLRVQELLEERLIPTRMRLNVRVSNPKESWRSACVHVTIEKTR